MALVHATRTGIPNDHGLISKANLVRPEVEEYIRRYVTDDKDWENVDDKDCWGLNYTEPTTEMKDKIESILHSWGGEHPEEKQAERRQLKLERERFSVAHASRDPETL